MTDGGCLAIGWDPPYDTFFLQVGEDEEIPAIWKGTKHGEHPDPTPLVELAKLYSEDIPANLTEKLQDAKIAEPGWPL